jgi:hypothetical protein
VLFERLLVLGRHEEKSLLEAYRQLEENGVFFIFGYFSKTLAF